jgi:two-component system sensor histidine kinase PilS (NtrC family)
VVEVDYLCRSAFVELRKRHPQAGVRLEGAGAARIRCLPEELILALRMVLENAAEAGAAPEEQILVRIGESGRTVRFQVEDNGPGFSSRREAFRPFFTTKPGHDGLGLFFCRALVERNGGSVEILPVPGGGACVQLTFSCEEKLR